MCQDLVKGFCSAVRITEQSPQDFSRVYCYKTRVWTDFRVRVRTEIRYSSSYIISL